MFIPEKKDISEYLRYSDNIDHRNTKIEELAIYLSEGMSNEIETAKVIYEFVRDKVRHSDDIKAKRVTSAASEVLQCRHGICYAKAHLLAALLRCLEIPAGFCYQRLLSEGETKPKHVIHGLNAVYLKSLSKWIRLDARGNKKGINAEFSTEEEKLAFPVRVELGEADYPAIYSRPDPAVLRALRTYKTVKELIANLPEEIENKNV